MNLPKEYRDKNKSKVVILPISFKTKTTRKNDSHLGPKAIIDASQELEYFEEDLLCEPHEKGIYTEEQLTLKETDFTKIKHKILDKIKKINNKFPIILGSDHSTTIPVVEALEEKEKNFGVIVFDAHSDLREPWGKDTWWHACVSREISKKHKTLLVGVRSMDNNDIDFLQSRKVGNVGLIFAKDLLSSIKQHNWDLASCFELEEKLRQLPKKIYISIDVDVFDPSIIRYTDTPEPGGLNWTQLNNLLKMVFEEKEVIGVDIVEFSPDTKNKAAFAESYLLAKLIYKMLAYKYYL
jgi:agmatinase